MDKKLLVEKLNTLFCNLNKEGKKYSQVWLTELDFGGLYSTNKYTLNVKADHDIDNCNEEVRFIVHLLYERAKDEYLYIFEVIVYNADNDIHCQSDDVMIYADDKACP